MAKRSYAVLSAVLILASCGGSDDSATSKPTSVGGGTPTPSQAPAFTSGFDKVLENVWQGTGPADLIVSVVIANAGDFWLMYGLPQVSSSGSSGATSWAGFASASGFLQGSLDGINGVVKSTNLKEFTSTGLSYGLNIGLRLDGTYTAALNFDATLTSDNASSEFKTKPAPKTSYLYAVTPKLSEIIATWTGNELVGTAVATSVISPQTVLAQKANITLRAGGCEAKGEIVPRISSLVSENLFDVSLTSGDGCDLRSNKKFSGIATSQKISSGKSQMVIMAVSEDRESGFAFWASK